MVAVARKLSMMGERLQEKSCLFHTGDYRNKGYNLNKLAWIQFPTKMVSVDWKLSMTEEWPKTEVVCFSKKIAGQNSINLSKVRVSVKMVSSAHKLSKIEGQCREQNSLFQ
jgi:hypothetical protein